MNGLDIGRFLVIFGICLIILGSFIMLISRFTSLGHLPGDIFIKGENGSFYFPIVSCILISLILSLILNLLNR